MGAHAAAPITTVGLKSHFSANNNYANSAAGAQTIAATPVNGSGFAAGIDGQGFSFDGVNDHVTIPADIALNNPNLTVAAWYKLDQLASGPRLLFGKTFGSGTHNSYAVWLNGNTINYGIGDTGTFDWQSVSLVHQVSQWNHVALAFSDDNNLVQLYLNGSLLNSFASTRSISYDNNRPHVLGTDIENGSPNYFFPGVIDEVRYYDRALSASEIFDIAADTPLLATTIRQVAGEVRVDGTLASYGEYRLEGGTLFGTGRVPTKLSQLGGTLSPGNSPGLLEIDGDYNLATAGTLFIETGGSSAGTEYDQLDVTGSVTLAGNLSAYVISTIVKGTQFTIINNDGSDPVVGSFAGLPEGAVFDNGYDEYRVSYVGGDGNDVVLTAITDVRVVNNTNDSGIGSLRGEIETGETIVDPTAIIFRIPGTGPFTIAPNTPLPIIDENQLFIDASTQPGYAGVPLVEISGTATSGDGLRFAVGGDASLVRGFAINRFSNSGIQISGADNISIAGNFIGTDITGSVDLGNTGNGIDLEDTVGTIIGGPNPEDRNVISGNDANGIALRLGTTFTYVEGNYVGLSADGITDLGNSANGISLTSSAGPGQPTRRNFIGIVGGAPNVISGNAQAGVVLADLGTSDNQVLNNLIGLNATGTGLIANAAHGVLVWSNASNNIIGQSGAGNAIAGTLHPYAAIAITTSGNTIQGNYIGTSSDGSLTLGGDVGINLTTETAVGNLIGGKSFGDGNTIRGMTLKGIESVTGNFFLGNSVYDTKNGVFVGDFLGIDIAPDGITTARMPVIDLAVSGVSSTRVGGTLTATPNTRYRVEVFSSPTANASGYGEGQTYLGFTNVTTDVTGFARFNFRSSTLVSVGAFISATATSDSEGTSEFALSVAARNSILVLNINDAGPDSFRQAVIDANVAGGGDVIEFQLPPGPGPGPEPGTIILTGSFPRISGRTIIDGSSQPNYLGTPLVEVTTNANASTIAIDGAGSELRGLSIGGGATSSVDVTADDVLVAGNYVGIDRTGLANNLTSPIGVYVSANRVTIGGAGQYDRNLIAGNSTNVFIDGTNDARVQGNVIGLDVTQTATLSATDLNGVIVSGNAQNTFIGTDGDGEDDSLEGNVIAGLTLGIAVNVSNSSNTVVAGNQLGVASNGSTSIANRDGISVGFFVPGLRIGTNGDGLSDLAERNVISGNALNGIVLSSSHGTVIAGNLIGTDVTGTVAIGNGQAGIHVALSNNVTIGGPLSAQRNIVSGNPQEGISFLGAATGTRIQNNFVGVNINGDSALPNSEGLVLSSGIIVGTDGDGINDATEGNVIAGNTLDIRVDSSNTLAGNRIGTDANGLVRLSNSFTIQVEGANNLIGTNADGVSDQDERNIISGNVFVDDFSISNVFSGNFIGFASDETTVLDPVSFAHIGGNLHTIGGSDAIERNYIAGEVNFVGAINATVHGNYLGVKPDGVTPTGVGLLLLADQSQNNQIGGAGPGEGNVISQVRLVGIETRDNIFEGNLLGTNASGTDGLGLDNAVVEIADPATNNFIGTPAAGNVISSRKAGAPVGASQTGVLLASGGNFIQNNLIGLNATGDGVIGNRYGVRSTFDGNQIGGLGLNEGNVISGNADAGVWLESQLNFVQGNFIGTDPKGRIGIGNSGPGISLTEFSDDVISDNLISANLGGGIVFGTGTPSGANVTILRNMIGTDITGQLAIPNETFGMRVLATGPNSVIDNLISGNNGPGILVEGPTEADIQLNWIGVTASGDRALPNLAGIRLLNGVAIIANNVVSGNLESGIVIEDSFGSSIATNIIGLDATGNTAIGNQQDGIRIMNSANNFIGSGLGSGNVISGNNLRGISIMGTGSTNNSIFGNFIGTDITGTLLRGNSQGGIRVGAGPVGTSIGSDRDGRIDDLEGNVISGNSGVAIEAFATSNLFITSNKIGASLSNAQLPNFGDGIRLESVSNAEIGDVVSERANFISSNTGNGITVTDTSTSINIRGNSIELNGLLGIDRGGLGPTPNDPFEADNVQNAAVLDSALVSGNQTSVVGTLTSIPNATFDVDFFASPIPDASLLGEGSRYLGSTTVVTDGLGFANLSSLLNAVAVGGEYISATVTNTNSDTSEFSNVVQAISNAPPTIVQDSLIVTVIGDNEEEATFGTPTLVVNEGDQLYLTGDFADADSTAQVRVFWGDGSSSGADVLRSESFTSDHVYTDDDPSASASNVYPVIVRVTDTDGSGSAVLAITVKNVDPVLITSGLTTSVANEGQTVTLTGSFTDPGTGDYHYMAVDWGDGTPVQKIAVPRGDRDFQADHKYADDRTAHSESSLHGEYAIRLSVIDDDRDLSLPQPGDVGFDFRHYAHREPMNLAPSATINAPSGASEGQTINFSAQVTDPGTADTFTYNWQVMRDGQGFSSGSEPTFSFAPVKSGTYFVTLTVSDDEFASTTVTRSISVLNAAPLLRPSDLVITSGGVVTSSIDEGGQINLSGIFSDSGASDIHSVTVDFGDGSTPVIKPVEFGDRAFSGFTHTYRDDRRGTNDQYLIRVIV